MATEKVTTLEYWMAPIGWDYNGIHLRNFRDWWESMPDDIIMRALTQEFFIKNYGTVITTSIMMSQTAADVHAVFRPFLSLRPYSVLDRVIFGTMGGVMKRIVKRGNYHHVPLFLDFLRRGLDSDDRYSVLDSVRRGERALEGIYKNETCDGALPSEHSQHTSTVAVAAVLHLLAFVFQYLIGYIDRGGTKTYSSGCFDFRASFVCVLLFLAAFVWIKFRQAAARPSTGKRKARSTQLDHPGDDSYDPSIVYVRGEKFEARYTIPMDKRDEAHPVNRPRLSLGLHKTREEAKLVSRVAQSYYEDQRGACCVKLGDHQFEFFVPAMSEQERGIVGEEKKKWVAKQAKDVGKEKYEEYAEQLAVATSTESSNPSSSLTFEQRSLMHSQTADREPLCVLYPGSQPAQDGPVCTSEGVEAHSFEEFLLSVITDKDIDSEDMFPSSPPNSESASIPENVAFPYFGAAVEHGPSEPLLQLIGAGDAVLHSVIERSESLVLSRQYQQPQVYGVQELLHQVSDESQNPAWLQQVHCMPSQQNFGRLQEMEPSEKVRACEQCERLREENKRLRVENERFKSMFQTVCNVVAGKSN